MHNIYYDEAVIRDAVANGRHRDLIGGLWDKMGRHQFRFLVEQGLTQKHRLLDIGCGSLRLGVRAIEYLDPGRYYGTDISRDLIDAGITHELNDASRQKAPRTNFGVSDNFDFSFLSDAVDVAVAQSVFTHLPLNHLRRCLAKLGHHIVPGGRFFVTYFKCPESHDIDQPIQQSPPDALFGSGVVSHDYKDPYHLKVSDLEWAADPATWNLIVMGDWGHARGQQMAIYVKR